MFRTIKYYKPFLIKYLIIIFQNPVIQYSQKQKAMEFQNETLSKSPQSHKSRMDNMRVNIKSNYTKYHNN